MGVDLYYFDQNSNSLEPFNTARPRVIFTPIPEPEPEPEPDPEPGDTIVHGTDLTVDDVGLTDESVLVSSGPISTTHDGEIIQDLHISTSEEPGIAVNHTGVTVRNCRIDHAGGQNGVQIGAGVTGTTVEYCRIDGMDVVLGNNGTTGVVGGRYTIIRRNFFTRLRVAVTAIRDHTDVVENWVESLKQDNGSHNNSFSYHGEGTGENVRFLRNRAISHSSGGITFYPRLGPILGGETRDNLVVGIGLGFGIRGGRSMTDLGHYCDNRDIKIEGNRFSGEFGWPSALGESTNAGVDLGRPGNTFSNNQWLPGHGATEGDLPARCGTSQNACEGDECS